MNLLPKTTLLQVLGLIAASLALAESDRVGQAELQKKVDLFRRNELGDDDDTFTALNSVVRAGQVALPSADATHAAEVTRVHLDSIVEEEEQEQEQGNKPEGDQGGSGDAGNEGDKNPTPPES